MAKRKKISIRKYIKQDQFFTILKRTKSIKDRKVNRLFGVHLASKIKLCKAEYEVLGCITLFLNKRIRSFDEWSPPKSKEPKKILDHLIRHLFAKYPLPDFFDKVWYKNDPEYQSWYIRLGQGENIRKQDLPLKYTKRMSHFFLQAPSTYSISEALRYGQVRGLGGDVILSRLIVESSIGQNFSNNQFWEKVIMCFVNYPDFLEYQVSPMIDYIQAQKFQIRRVEIGEDQFEEILPPNPDFEIKGKTPTSIIKSMRDWHQGLWKRNEILKNKTWNGANFSDFEYEDDSGEKVHFYQIIQIKNSLGLFNEGLNMGHCVSSYAFLCIQGDRSIWSLREYNGAEFIRKATIEVNSQNEIVQARGKCNRKTSKTEQRIIRKWAASEGLVKKYYH